MAKYDPLFDFLRATPPGVPSCTLSFAQIEVIIRDHLPSSAWKYSAWWANERAPDTRHVQAVAWLAAGWEVDVVDLEQGWVRFHWTRYEPWVQERWRGLSSGAFPAAAPPDD
jgi:hypothetical protein